MKALQVERISPSISGKHARNKLLFIRLVNVVAIR
jgi:hypothetical protein